VDRNRLVVALAQLALLVLPDDDVLALRVLVRGNDLVVRNLAVNGADLLVPNALVAPLVEEVEPDLPAAAPDGVECLHGDRNQVKRQVPFPTRPRRHDPPPHM